MILSCMVMPLHGLLQFIVAFLAAIRARAIAAPLNAYTEEEFLFYLEDSSAVLVIVPANEGNQAAEGAAQKLNLPIIEAKWKDSDDGVDLSSKFKAEFSSEPCDISQVSNHIEDEALFLHTSGTTSRPKGVPLTQINLSASVQHIVEAYELGPSDKTAPLSCSRINGRLALILSGWRNSGSTQRWTFLSHEVLGRHENIWFDLVHGSAYSSSDLARKT